jgi:ATP-dependent Clp protease ATP-binding subunit ClpB
VIQELAGEGNYEQMKDAVMEIVRQHFRPEFINRIDESVVFRPLLPEHIRSICVIQISALEERLQDRDITLSVSDAAMEKISKSGFDPVYGARPLKRAIQFELENPLATKILNGDFPDGSAIRVDVADDNLVFSLEDVVEGMT